MNLPFSPTLFSKIDAFQQLKEYEKENKPTWDAEKRFLMWASSDGHAHRGTPVGTDHLHDALKVYQEAGTLPNTSGTFVERVNGHIILDALETRGYVIKFDENRIKFTQSGFIAGKILRDTEMLTSSSFYASWGKIWWIVFVAVSLLLVLQILNSAGDFVGKINSLWKRDHQPQFHQHRINYYLSNQDKSK